MKFCVLKGKNLIILCVVSIICCFTIFSTIKLSYAAKRPSNQITIAIDAGHGGRDGGCVGVNTKVKESDLALSISKKIKNYLSVYGYNVVLTRKNDNGLYGSGKNKKLQDMEARKKIINESASDCLISIHLNSFSNREARGAQTFFSEDNEKSQIFSSAIQSQLSFQLPNAKNDAKSGDYYILKCSPIPSVLVECGYLSNEEEEKLLITNEYQEKIAYAVFCGVLKFFNYTYS